MFYFSPNKFLKINSLILLILFFLNIFSIYIYKLFDNELPLKIFGLDYEVNIPTTYSSLLLIFASLVSFKIFKKDHLFRNIWFLSAIIFLFLSIDEFFMIHEQLPSLYLYFFNKSSLYDLPKFFRFWFFTYMIFGAGLFFFYKKFWFYLYPRYKRLFFFSIFIYALGELILEILAYIVVKFYEIDFSNMILISLTTIEETLAIGGIIIFSYTLLIILNLDSINQIYLSNYKKFSSKQKRS